MSAVQSTGPNGHSGSVRTTGQAPSAVFSNQQFSATLPKGGGAIRGLQEKVDINAAHGTARLSIPLPSQFLRGGLSPELNLSYHSGDGNGPFGAGWNVGVPAISRRTDFGVPVYRDDEESDRFMASGLDELVRVVDEYDNNVERYHDLSGFEQPATPVGPHYAVRSYRPRSDSTFTVVEWWRKMTFHDDRWHCSESFWRTITRNCVTSLYGFTAAARLSAPDDATRVYQWSLERMFDDRGNAVLFEYASDAGEEGEFPFASPCYLVAIKHSPSTPYDRSSWLAPEFPRPGSTNLPIWLFVLRFDYGEPIGQSTDTLKQLIERCEDPTFRNRCVAPTKGPVRLDTSSSSRSGFMLRTRRLCRRVLSFHHIPGGYDGLVRSMEFTYQENVYLSKLIAITQVMWDGPKGRAFPPIQLRYADVPDLQRARVEKLEMPALPAMRPVLDQPHFSWVDLDAEGAPGALFQAADGNWLFARNRGGGRLAPPEPVHWQSARDALTASDNRPRLADLNADGLLDWVELRRPWAGHRERRSDYTWGEFKPFSHSPVLEMDDANVRMFDLDGDGLVDLVRSEPGSYLWQRSLGDEGFAVPERLPWGFDERHGPRLLFGDRNATVYLADITGDGLTDLIRLRNGEMSYWPNLGCGKFGHRRQFVICDENGHETGEPLVFDRSERFEQRRIRLLDIDGTGAVDLAYIGVDGVRVWRNQSGNGLSKPISIPFPPVDDPEAVSVVDLLANGTSCLVYTPPTPGFSASALYLHLVGGQSHEPGTSPITSGAQRPHLLTRYTNHLGGETLFYYTSSARFCVEDRERGRPWITKLGFPVHVIERVEKRDLVTGKVVVNRYRYRHGHFDGKEREFNGFAFVEQTDSVRYEDFTEMVQAAFGVVAANESKSFYTPPAITRTWYHTGAGSLGASLSQRLRSEYFGGDSEAIVLPDTQFEDSLDAREARQAIRALRGAILRQEIYSGDASPGPAVTDAAYGTPHTVSERSYNVRRVQRTGSNRFASYFVHPSQQIDYQYERRGDDPRVEHQLTLEIDHWGNVVKSAKVAYGRRPAGLKRAAEYLTDSELSCQARLFVEYADRTFTNAFGDPVQLQPSNLDYHAPFPAAERTWELHACQPSRPSGWFIPADFETLPPEVPYRTDPSAITQPCRRLIENVESSYWRDDGSGALPIGQLEIPGLPHRSWKLALTMKMVQELSSQANDKVPGYPLNDQLLFSAGYDKRDEAWWAKSPYFVYGAPFRLATENIDSFDNRTSQSYDAQLIFPLAIVDPEADTTRIDYDYRLLQPQMIMDANASRTRVMYDTRGFVVATALEGNSTNPTEDRISVPSADFNADEITAFAGDPLSLARGLLGSATTRCVYNLFAAMPTDLPVWLPDSNVARKAARVNPVWAATLARQFHVAQEAAFGAHIEMAFAYSDGFGEVAQTNQLTDPDLLDPLDKHSPSADPRWIRSGLRLVNNKNAVVRQYDPKFSDTHYFAIGMAADERPVPTVFYDALQRIVARLVPHRNYRQADAPPDGVAGVSYDKHLFNSWDEVTWDVNDTVAIDPMADADVSTLFSSLPDSEIGPSWEQVRSSPILLKTHWPNDLQRQKDEADAANVTRAHANTPACTFLDPLGRPFLSIAHQCRETNAADEYFHTRTEYDIKGNRLAIYDAHDREVMGWDYHMLGVPTRSRSMDAGERVLLFAVDGQIAAEWDDRGHHLATRYDKLRRVRELRVNNELKERFTYGSSGSGKGSSANYQRGRLIEQTDEAGDASVRRYDVHGKPAVVLRDGRLRIDEYDAQLRLVRSDCDNQRIDRTYTISGQLTGVTTRPGGAVVTSIAYNASGQRVQIIYGGAGGRALSTFDPSSGRLYFQHTHDRKAQDLHQVYDPIGNIVHIRDRSVDTVYFKNQAVEPHQTFAYDPLYRLARATGREHRGQTTPPPTDWERKNFTRPVVHPSDGTAMRRYVQTYSYDAVGNPLEVRHRADGNDWTRVFAYDPASNRLLSTATTNVAGSVFDAFSHDAHGNMTDMGGYHTDMEWDYRDRLLSLKNANGTKLAEFRYDAAGQRVSKIEGDKEHAYFGDFELYENKKNSLVVHDGHGILAIIDHKSGADVQFRIQLSNHLGSCSTEISGLNGSNISHEEYHPFGTTSYHAHVSGQEAKRYRFTAKERDASTGLSYHGARYYAPWLARWISADPSRVRDGPNLYSYAGGNPVSNFDDSGEFAVDWKAVAVGAAFTVGAVVVVSAAIAVAPFALTAASIAITGNVAAAIATSAAIGTFASSAAGATAIATASAAAASFAVASAAKQGTEIWSGREMTWTGGIGRQLSDSERSQKAGELLGLGLLSASALLASKIAPSAGSIKLTRPLEVNEETIAASLKNSTMASPQGKVSLPMVERYVRRLEAGEVPPPIKVEGNVIIDGNHRYIAGKVFGTEPPTTPGTLSPSQVTKVRSLQSIEIDPIDWRQR